MYHWYRLLKDEKAGVAHAIRPSAARDGQALIAHGRGRRVEGLSPGEKRRLFWLGLVEVAPVSAGTVAGLNLEPPFASVSAVALGIMVTLVVIWLLRERVPELPIEIAESTSFDDV